MNLLLSPLRLRLVVSHFAMRLLALCLASLPLAACAISPPPATLPQAMCNFVQYPIEVGLEQNGAPTSFETQVRTAIAANPNLPVLALSGGSQHGAFGAGFLDGWRQAPEGRQMPEFSVVTGISTGAILSTFAFTGDTARAVQGYTIVNERELLTPIVHMRNGQPTARSMIGVLQRGAVADLTPLRDMLRRGIDHGVLAEVARRHRAGRRLYMGLVDVDSGQAAAFDMGEMADRYIRAGGPEGSPETDAQKHLRDCYVSAIVGSSSVPMSALPAFIDNHMYIDGGARFGMFVEDVIHGVQVQDKDSGSRTRIYVVANGDLEVEPHCGKSDTSLCNPTSAPSGGTYGRHSTWSFTGLAERSEDILVNQIYRFSAARILDQAKDRIYFARIRADMLAHLAPMDDPALGSGTLTCAEWRAMDRDTLHPIQFYPRYMRCLIHYGRQRALVGDWDVPPAAPVAVPSPKP